jgi:3'-5' exoribonuclease
VDSQVEKMTPVRVDGTVSVYREKPQITVRSVTRLQWTPDLYSRLMPASQFGRAEMEERLRVVLSSVRNPDIKALVKAIMGDSKLWERFTAVPAAKQIHHAYLRGLLEHTLSMMEIGAMLAEHYDLQFPGVIDRDLVLVGALLHDIGKTWEYEYEQGIDISTQGRLVGHLVLGIEALDRALATLPGFPALLAHRVKHMIVSHHGEPEMGAPLRPITPEAVLLHQIDLLDSQVNAVATLVSAAGQEEFTQFSNKFDRRFFNSRAPMNREPPDEDRTRAEPKAERKEGTRPQAAAPVAAKEEKAERKEGTRPQAAAPVAAKEEKVGPRSGADSGGPQPARADAARGEVTKTAPAVKVADLGGDVWEKEIPSEAPAGETPAMAEPVEVVEEFEEGGADRTGQRKKKKNPSLPELF